MAKLVSQFYAKADAGEFDFFLLAHWVVAANGLLHSQRFE
jgi:hypothetical protein